MSKHLREIDSWTVSYTHLDVYKRQSLTTLKSMQARGYGKKVRTNFHTYIFESRDQIVLIVIILLDFIFIFGYITRYASFYYYPIIKTIEFGLLDILYYIGYLLLLALPCLLYTSRCV